MSTQIPRSDRSSKLFRQQTGIGHWQRTLGRHVWFLRHAGITSEQIEREVTKYLRQCDKIRVLPVPVAEERIYPRILAHWQHQCAYLDKKGQPRALRFEGRSPTFRSLVSAAAPESDPSKVLGALKRNRLISQSSDGVIRLVVDDFSTHAVQRGPLLSATLAALDALTDTCYANLQVRQPKRRFPRLQRLACTEYFDRRHLRAYDEFLSETVHVFLAMHETWLKHHEVKRVDPRNKQISRVGVGVFAIRGH